MENTRKCLDYFFYSVSLIVTEKGIGIGIPLIAILISPKLARHLLSQFSIQLIINNYLKNYTRVPRPEIQNSLQIQEKGYGFPSLHSSTAMALALVTNDFFKTNTNVRQKSLIASCLLIGLARTHLGVHTWSDVSAGWTLGYMGYRAEQLILVKEGLYPPWLAFLITLVMYTSPAKKESCQHLIHSFREGLIGLGTYLGTNVPEQGWGLAFTQALLVLGILRVSNIDADGPHVDIYRTVLKYFLSSDALFRILEQL